MKKVNTSRWEHSIFGLPPKPGVYCVFVCNVKTQQKRILYIGSSKNIEKRVMNSRHPYRILFDKFKYPEMVATKSKVCDNYIELETRLIKRLKPEYNTQHSNPHLCQ